MKTLYAVYRDETLIGLVSSEDAGWRVVALDEPEKSKSDPLFTDYRVEKIYTNLEFGL